MLTQTPDSQINQSTHYALLSKFSTGNPLIDPIIHAGLYTLITIIMFNLQKILNFSNITYYIGGVLRVIFFYYYKYFKKEPDTIDKQVIIDYITDNKKVNSLYLAVSKYLAVKSNLDLLKESPLKFSCEEDIDDGYNVDVDVVKFDINKKISENKYKSLIYKNYEIFYLLNSSLITVYADVERKRENYTITLSTKINKSSTIDILEDFSNFCLLEYIKSKRSNIWAQQIFVNGSDSRWVSSSSNNRRKIDTVILKNNLIGEIKQEITSFVDSEDWYRERGIPYTWGYLFYGEPGTGKTSLINGISNFTKRHIHYLMLNNIKSDNELLDLLKDIKYKESILVIEDIDCMSSIIEERETKAKENLKLDSSLDAILDSLSSKVENKCSNLSNLSKEKSSLTLSGLLNAIDGVFNNDGRILIMTTNRPEVLDKALIRSGRVNRKICFDNCSKSQVEDIYLMMFGEKIDSGMLDSNIDYSKFSSADITGLFLRYKNSPKEALLNFDKIEKIVFSSGSSKSITSIASDILSKNKGRTNKEFSSMNYETC